MYHPYLSTIIVYIKKIASRLTHPQTTIFVLQEWTKMEADAIYNGALFMPLFHITVMQTSTQGHNFSTM